MKWWFKVNRNNLYRKYNFDPHNFILKSFKMDKSFKFIVSKKKYYLILDIKRRRYKKKKSYKYRIRTKPRRLKWRRIRQRNTIISASKLRRNKKWYSDFWKKIKINYFFKKKKLIRKRRRRIFKLRYSFKEKRKSIRKAMKFKITLAKRRRRTTARKRYKTIMKKLYFQAVWLFIKRYRKRKKDWWLVRINLRKTAIYYGFTNLKKFRFVNKYVAKSMPIKTYYDNKLENMLNIFLLKIGLFDNIFISNNFIQVSGHININFKKVFDPYAYVRVKDIISFVDIKKIQNIYKKRCMFSKSAYLKRRKKSKNLSKNIYSSILVKIIYNVPKYIHYDYQIMCFCVYRLPNRKELFYSKNKLKDTWSIDTRLEYN